MENRFSYRQTLFYCTCLDASVGQTCSTKVILISWKFNCMEMTMQCFTSSIDITALHKYWSLVSWQAQTTLTLFYMAFWSWKMHTLSVELVFSYCIYCFCMHVVYIEISEFFFPPLFWSYFVLWVGIWAFLHSSPTIYYVALYNTVSYDFVVPSYWMWIGIFAHLTFQINHIYLTLVSDMFSQFDFSLRFPDLCFAVIWPLWLMMGLNVRDHSISLLRQMSRGKAWRM